MTHSLLSISENLDSLVPYFEPAKNITAVTSARTCYGSLGCIPCPYDKLVYNDYWYSLSIHFQIPALIGCLILFMVIISILILPKKTINSSKYTTGLMVSLLCVDLAHLLSFTTAEAAKTQCYDAITRARATTVVRCAFSGSLTTFGMLLFPTWLILWVVYMNLQIVNPKFLRKHEFLNRTWVPYVVAYGIPTILTAAALKYQEYIIGRVCLPRAGTSIVYTLLLPALCMLGGAAVVQIYTFGYIVATFYRLRTKPTANFSENPIVKSIRLFWKALVVTSMAVVIPFPFAVAGLRTMYSIDNWEFLMIGIACWYGILIGGAVMPVILFGEEFIVGWRNFFAEHYPVFRNRVARHKRLDTQEISATEVVGKKMMDKSTVIDATNELSATTNLGKTVEISGVTLAQQNEAFNSLGKTR